MATPSLPSTHPMATKAHPMICQHTIDMLREAMRLGGGRTYDAQGNTTPVDGTQMAGFVANFERQAAEVAHAIESGEITLVEFLADHYMHYVASCIEVTDQGYEDFAPLAFNFAFTVALVTVEVGQAELRAAA